MQKFKVQILLATCNGEKYLREQLESLRNQTYDDWECLISDDCSTDSTLDIIREYCEIDARFKLVSKERRYYSASYNFLHLMSVSDADFLLFCDQDDYWLSNKVEVLLNKILDESDDSYDIPICVFSDAKLVNKNLESFGVESFQSTLSLDANKVTLLNLMTSNVVQGCACVINKRLAEIVVNSSDFAYFPVYDWFAGAIAKSQGKLVYIPDMLHLYRQHDSNSVGAQKLTLRKWIRDLRTCEKESRGGAKEEIKRESWAFARARRILNDFKPRDNNDIEELKYLTSFINAKFFGKIKILNHYKWFNSFIGYRIALFIVCFKPYTW